MEEDIKEFDKLKTKVLKYVLYKKRTENEIRQKFSENTGKMLDNVIKLLKENNYINDKEYIERAINEYIALSNLSIKEVKYKLMCKGISADKIDDYICENKEKLLEYEFISAKSIMIKKANTLQQEDIEKLLLKKGYITDIIKAAALEKDENN